MNIRSTTSPARPWRRLALAAALGACTLGAALAPASAQAYGRWEHGWHGGRMGWWWVDAGLWSWYASPWGYPYYAYPGYPYAAPYYAPPAAAAPGNLPPQAPTWYYCDAARGYYPYVSSCPGPWRAVPAGPAEPLAPAPSASALPPPAPPPPSNMPPAGSAPDGASVEPVR
jgi:hypothetical protein